MSDTPAPPTPRLSGLWVPVLTPFRADLSPDGARLLAHCRWLLSQGSSGLAVFGTTSEANSLSVEEKEGLLGELVAGGIDPARLLPGTGACALPDAVRLTRRAVAAGCAGVLVLPPFYYKQVSEDGLFRSFAELVERVGDARLRLVLYHIPPVAQVPITPGLIERLLRAYPRTVAGIKDSSGDMESTRLLLARFAGPDFAVFPGSERFLLAGLRGGGAGCITATGNVNPGPIGRLAREWRSPDADARQEALNAVRSAVEKLPAIAALKEVLAHFACDPAWRTVRPPLTPLGFGMPGLATPVDRQSAG